MATLTTRRRFITQASLAIAGTVIGTKSLSAVHLSIEAASGSQLPATAWLPEPISNDALRAMAAAALDAARSAGASYADVRVSYVQYLRIYVDGGIASPDGVTIKPQFMYGMRVCVDGAWAFVHGTVPSVDAITTLATNGVATARGYAKIHSGLNLKPKELAPAPVVTGEWETPYELDPFTVPLADQCALLSAYGQAVGRVRNGMLRGSTFGWQYETRVFASTEGSLCTQKIRQALPEIIIGAGFLRVPHLPSISIPLLGPSSGGYERVAIPGLQQEIARQTEQAAKLIWLPQRPLDVGRYPVVMDGTSLGSLFVFTLGRALESDRAIGMEGGASGTCYLSPPEEVLGTLVTNTMLTVTAHRKTPSVTAVKWDDDGVEPQEFPLIKEGMVANYATSRHTCSELTSSLTSSTASSNGCAVATQMDSPVLVRLPHASGSPSSTKASLEDLYKDMKRGVLLHRSKYMAVDPSLGSGVVSYNATMLEVKNGKIVGFVKGNGLQFSAPRLWKSLTALGDISTVQDTSIERHKGQPGTRCWHSATMPAALFKEIDIVNSSVRI